MSAQLLLSDAPTRCWSLAEPGKLLLPICKRKEPFADQREELIGRSVELAIYSLAPSILKGPRFSTIYLCNLLGILELFASDKDGTKTVPENLVSG